MFRTARGARSALITTVAAAALALAAAPSAAQDEPITDHEAEVTAEALGLTEQVVTDVLNPSSWSV